jgi:uncharacterized membrane protein YgcG
MQHIDVFLLEFEAHRNKFHLPHRRSSSSIGRCHRPCSTRSHRRHRGVHFCASARLMPPTHSFVSCFGASAVDPGHKDMNSPSPQTCTTHAGTPTSEPAWKIRVHVSLLILLLLLSLRRCSSSRSGRGTCGNRGARGHGSSGGGGELE